jgi:Cu2+-exporting ATPase
MPAAFAIETALPTTLVDDPLEQGRFTRWIVHADGSRLAESSLRLGGMHCSACAGLIEEALAGVPGVVSARVNAAADEVFLDKTGMLTCLAVH